MNLNLNRQYLAQILLFCALLESVLVSSKEYLIQYKIPDASVVHWNYYYPPSSNKFQPSLPSSNQIVPVTSHYLTSTTTVKTITSSPASATINKPSSSGSVNGVTDSETDLADEFINWAVANPDPNKKFQQMTNPTNDYEDYDVLTPEEFSLVMVPEKRRKCPPGQKFFRGGCRRGFINPRLPRPNI